MTDFTSPPTLDTLDTPAPPKAEKRITPLRPHAPPLGTPTSHSVTGSPPETSIFFSLPGTKKPMKRLSGDQKGKLAPSVPASGFPSAALRGRTQSCTLPPVAAVKASHLPSGDTAMSSKLDFSGGRMENFISRASFVTGWRVKYVHANPNIPSADATATIQASRAWPSNRKALGLSGSADDAVVVSNCESGREPDGVDKASSAKLRSCAEWKRRSGCFSKHRRTIFSSCGLTFVFVSPSSGGSSFKIAFITSTANSPPKARRPDSIS